MKLRLKYLSVIKANLLMTKKKTMLRLREKCSEKTVKYKGGER